MKAKKLISLIIIACSILYTGEALAVSQKSQPVPGDRRIRYFTYQPNTVFQYTGFLRYAARIDLDPEESINSITMGDPTGWQISPVGHRLFLKPIELDAVTNMVIITSKRTYYFELYSKEADGIDDSELVWATSFNYGDSSSSSGAGKDFYDFSSQQEVKNYVPNPMESTVGLNMNYTISGNKTVAPLEVFDDGEFTYFKFKDINADIPAIFQVLPDGNEALINYRVSSNGYIVVERVANQFTLRHGDEIVCVFNEKDPLVKVAPKKK